MEIALFLMLALFILAEGYVIIRSARMGKTQCISRTAVPTGLFAAYLLAICLLRIRIPYVILILSTFSVFLHTFVGTYLNVYRKSETYDRYLHGFGTFSFAILIYLTLAQITAPGGSVLFRAVFVACIGIAAGVLFELLEFHQDRKKGTDMQRGLVDTDYDLLFDVLGAIAAAVLSAFAYL